MYTDNSLALGGIGSKLKKAVKKTRAVVKKVSPGAIVASKSTAATKKVLTPIYQPVKSVVMPIHKAVRKVSPLNYAMQIKDARHAAVKKQAMKAKLHHEAWLPKVKPLPKSPQASASIPVENISDAGQLLNVGPLPDQHTQFDPRRYEMPPVYADPFSDQVSADQLLMQPNVEMPDEAGEGQESAPSAKKPINKTLLWSGAGLLLSLLF